MRLTVKAALGVEVSAARHHVDRLRIIASRNLGGILRSVTHAGLEIRAIRFNTTDTNRMPSRIHRIVVRGIVDSWSRWQHVIPVARLIVDNVDYTFRPSRISTARPTACISSDVPRAGMWRYRCVLAGWVIRMRTCSTEVGPNREAWRLPPGIFRS